MGNDVAFFELIEFLALEKDVELTFTTKANAKCDAEYSPVYRENKSGEWNLKKHRIKLFVGNELERDLNSLIAHELIHAWQEENGKDEIHGKHFRKMSRKLEAEFGLLGIYNPEIDE